MRKPLVIIIGIVVVLGLLGAFGGVFIVDETEQVVVTQFGEPKGEPITEPGLKVKKPFIQVANYFDKRFLEWDGDPNQVPTRDKRFIHVDTYARWRITDARRHPRRRDPQRDRQARPHRGGPEQQPGVRHLRGHR
jgi:membrane protease subunit HflC